MEDCYQNIITEEIDYQIFSELKCNKFPIQIYVYYDESDNIYSGFIYIKEIKLYIPDYGEDKDVIITDLQSVCLDILQHYHSDWLSNKIPTFEVVYIDKSQYKDILGLEDEDFI